MTDDGHIKPAVAALDLISRNLPQDKSSIPVEELFKHCDAVSAAEFRDGLRILIERGVIHFVPAGDDERPHVSIL